MDWFGIDFPKRSGWNRARCGACLQGIAIGIFIGYYLPIVRQTYYLPTTWNFLGVSLHLWAVWAFLVAGFLMQSEEKPPMTSEYPTPRRRRFQFSLSAALAITAVLGVAFARSREHDWGETVWFVTIPFAAGLATGDIMPKRSRFDVASIAIVPFVSTVVVAAFMFVAGVVEATVNPNPNDPAPLWLVPFQGLAVAMMYLPGGFIYGAIPSLAGAALSHARKKAN
jgi:hypothetical protein